MYLALKSDYIFPDYKRILFNKMTKKVPKTFVNGDDYYDPYYEPLPTMPPTQTVSSATLINNRTLQVSADPSELTDSEVVNYFTQFGPIEEVTTPFDKMKNKWKGFLYIVFESATIVNELIKTPTKMINGKKVLVAKKSASNSITAGPNLPNIATATTSAFSNIMSANIPEMAMGFSMFSSAPLLSSSVLSSLQNLELPSFPSIDMPSNIAFPTSGLPLSTSYPYATASASGYSIPSGSGITELSGFADPSGVAGSKKK